MELRYLEEAVDSALSGSRYENDVKRLALVAISLSEFLIEKLNDVQRDYLHSAKMFWSGNLSEEKRIEFVRRQGHVVDLAEREKSTDTRQASVERLVWAGMLTTTPLTSHAGEFLIDLAKDAGLSADEIFSAFEAHVPELSSYRP